MRHLRSIVASIALAALTAPLLSGAASAAIFRSSTPEPEASLNFKTTAGTLTGKWAYRSIAITGNPKATFASMALGSSEFDLVEQGGKITGTRPGSGKNKT